MKAISLWQPWASAIACDSKRVETRSWKTNYRGPLAIHAAKRRREFELIDFHSCWNWQGAMWPLGWKFGNSDDRDKLPFGALVATCNIVDCRPTDSFTQSELDTPRMPPGENRMDLYEWTERQMGDFSLGRFGWLLENIVMLPEPVPYKGSQGFFSVPDELLTVDARHQTTQEST